MASSTILARSALAARAVRRGLIRTGGLPLAAPLLVLAGRLAALDLPLESCAEDQPQLLNAIAALNYQDDEVATPQDGLGDQPAVLILSATPEHLRQLVEHQADLATFTGVGGWVLLSGLDAQGLADFNRLVGVQHLLRPFLSERVIPTTDPLAAGLRIDDIAMTSQIDAWNQEIQVAADAYGPFVDTDNVAPFAKLPDFSYFKHPDSNNDHDPHNLVGGFGRESWRKVFAMYPSRTPMSFPMVLPQPIAISSIDLVTSRVYPGIAQVEFSFDDAPGKLLLDTPGAKMHHLEIDPPRTVTTIHVRIAKWDENGRDVVGIENILINQVHPPGWTDRVHPLTNTGALVAYPQGSGGIVLCQLAFHDNDLDFNNPGRRQRILGRLLTNLHANRATTRLHPLRLPADAARGQPVPLAMAASVLPLHQGLLGETAEPSWPPAEAVLGGCSCAIGAGKQLVALARPGSPVGVVVGTTADALVLVQAAEYPASVDGVRLGCYRVVYADGGISEIPVVAGRDVLPLFQEQPAGVGRAQLVWIAGAGARHTALYLRQWDNPRPGTEISRIELEASQPAAAIALVSLTTLTAPPR